MSRLRLYPLFKVHAICVGHGLGKRLLKMPSFSPCAASKKKEQLIGYFDAIGRRYDLADTLMSFGLHFLWRKTCLNRLGLRPGLCILDLCGGTGEFARLALKAMKGTGVSVVCDLSMSMMAAGKDKANRVYDKPVYWVRGDAEALGFADQVFDAVIVGFGVRNLVHLDRGLQEIFRVLTCGGKLLVLEFSIPVSPWVRAIHHWYSFKVMPGFGKAITRHDTPFRYLAESVVQFPSPESLTDILRRAGFSQATFKRLTNGIVSVHVGTK